MIRDSVREFVALGPLPSESAPLEEFEKPYLSLFERIERPVSTDEAMLLLGSFGEDGSYGLAWSLLHLIETAPENAVADPPAETANEWIRRLWLSAQRGGG